MRLGGVSSPGSRIYEVDQRGLSCNLGSELKLFVPFSWSIIKNINWRMRQGNVLRAVVGGKQSGKIWENPLRSSLENQNLSGGLI